MKKHRFGFTILLIVSLISFASCGSRMNSPSPFLRKFSLGETVKRINLGELGILSAGVSGTSSAGPPTSRRQENDELFTIAESKINNFDEHQFLVKLQQQLSEEIGNSGLTVRGSGSGGDTFHINYESKEFKGGIDVIGIRTEKDKYRVWCVVRELAFGETQKL